MLEKKHNRIYIYGAQVLFVTILSGAHGFNMEHINKWLTVVARYTAYILFIRGFNEACFLMYSYYKSKKQSIVKNALLKSKQYIIIMAAAIGVMFYNKTQIMTEEFLLLFIAHLVTKYPEINQNLDIINYGVGMACSFFEGYLVHIIPSDGHRFVGFEENIVAYEATHKIVFPVKRLFIVITKSLFCPPDLKHFNKINKNVPFLEDCTLEYNLPSTQKTDDKLQNCIPQHSDLPTNHPKPRFQSLSDVEKDVAGVKNRIYRNSAYKIHRHGAPVVYVSAECATPIHTLHRVLERTMIYNELANVDRHELRDDFFEMLKSIISRSPEARGKCELVFFDDEDPSQNLADVLLDKIRELEPDFENIITKKE